ncbi:hypothetical protein [Planktothrix phage Pra-JY27]|nr:hypothetical protein [Planktothrix phage Pag-Yong1]WEV89268.1 DUF6011 domain-containing protein [Synechococcus phage MinM2]
MTDTELGTKLRDLLDAGRITARDQGFATSLLGGFLRWRSFTGRQRPHVERMIREAENPQPAPPQRAGLDPIVGLFRQARDKGLKRPKVWLRLSDGTDVRLTVAGDSARHPGTVNVTDGKGFEDGTWFGRVGLDGTWQPSPRVAEPATLYAALTCLAADPAKTAALHGQRTGSCAFCARGLDDARSIAVGYGPICAEKWGLPWGEDTLEPAPKAAVGTKKNPVRGKVSRMLAA